MSDVSIQQRALQWQPDDLGCSLEAAGVPVSVVSSNGRPLVRVALGYPHAGVRASYLDSLRAWLGDQASSCDLELEARVVPHRNQNNLPALDQVSNVIAVSSGKGGVGKSTTAVNLALALQAEGARVGLLDADVFGPSVPMMLGIPEGQRPEVIDQRWFVPVPAHGLQTMSMGYLVDDSTPVVWRGPKASGALQQLVAQTRWQQLDYLLVDLPPGTGDIQLTLAQRVPVAGSVVVTTPQDLALLDAIKGIEMFRKVDIHVLGIVENMALHVCEQCGHQSHPFGSGGGEQVVQRYQTRLLGQLPLALRIREEADSGRPTVAADPSCPEAQLYRQAARRLAALLSLRPGAARAFPAVTTES